MISFETNKDFKHIDSFFEKMLEVGRIGELNKYGRMGVAALKENTPKDTGLLKDSWGYEIERTVEGTKIIWTNDDVEGGFNVAILLQYGHGTKTGHWVEGIDFINPALAPVFNKIAEDAWKEVTDA